MPVRESGPGVSQRGVLLVLRAAAVLVIATGVNDVIAGAVPSYQPLYVYLGAVALVVWLDGALIGLVAAVIATGAYALLFLPRPVAMSTRVLAPLSAMLGTAIVAGVVRAFVLRRRREPPQFVPVVATPLLAPPPVPGPDMTEVLDAIEDLREELRSAVTHDDADELERVRARERTLAREHAEAETRVIRAGREIESMHADLLDRTARIRELETTLESERAGARGTAARVTELQNERLELRRAVETARTNAGALTARNERLEKESHARAEELRHELDLARLEATAQAARVMQAEARMKVFEGETADLRAALATAAAAETRARDLEARLAEAGAHAHDLEARAMAAESRAVEAEARAHGAEGASAETDARAREAEAGAAEAETRARDLEARLAEAGTHVHDLEARAVAAESRAAEAEARAHGAESSTAETDARARKAESRALAAEIRARDLEARAVAAESRGAEAEVRAHGAEGASAETDARAREAESLVAEANARARDLEARAVAAESRAAEAEARAHGAEGASAATDARAREAEARARDLESRAIDAEVRVAAADARALDAAARVGASDTLASSHAARIAELDADSLAQLERIAELQTVQVALSAKLEHSHARVEILEAEKRELQAELETALAAEAEKERSERAFDERLQTIVNHLAADHEADLGKAVEEREAARAEARSLNGRVGSMQRMIEDMRGAAQNEIDRLRRRIDDLERGAAQPAERRPRVLVAYPDPDMRAAARASLERAGYEILSAADGLEALRTAIASRPDVVIADAAMPKMDGRELCQMLKSQEKTAAIRVVLLTRAGETVPRGEHPADEILHKPVPLEALKSALAQLVPSTRP